jgi:hypothetical protein
MENPACGMHRLLTSYFVGLIDLCSKNSSALLTPVALDDLVKRATSGGRVSQTHPQVQKLASRLGSETCSEICDRYAAGEAAGVIAADYRVSRNAVLNLVRSRSIVVRAQAMTNEQVQLAAQLYESGLPIAAVQREVGASYGAVRSALMKGGVAMRPRGFQPNVPRVSLG